MIGTFAATEFPRSRGSTYAKQDEGQRNASTLETFRKVAETSRHQAGLVRGSQIPAITIAVAAASSSVKGIMSCREANPTSKISETLRNGVLFIGTLMVPTGAPVLQALRRRRLIRAGS